MILLEVGDIAFIITIVVLAIAFLVFWIKTMIEIGHGTFKDDTHKVLWLIFVFIMPLIGMIFYYLLGRSRRIS
jgi:hypothetical protein